MADQPSLEIRLPISPNAKYLRMVRYFLCSLVTFGGPIGKRAHVVLSVSRDAPKSDLMKDYPWLDHYNVSVRWVDETLFRDLEYDATGVDRFWVKSDSDVVAMMDADMLIAGDFDALVRQCFHQTRLMGFIAHVSPFSGEKPSEQHWIDLFAQEGLAAPDMSCEHTGWGYMAKDSRHRFCPPYFNYGMVLAPRLIFEKMAATALDDIRASDRYFSTWFRSQIALTLGIFRHDISWGCISINDNFPMHTSAEEIRRLNPDLEGLNEPEHIRIFHYLGDGEINKGHFSDEATLIAALARPGLSPTARLFADRMTQLRRRMTDAVKDG